MGSKQPSETPDVGHIQNPEVSHEASDVSIRPIFWFLFWLGVSTVVIFLLMGQLFNYFSAREARRDPPPPILAGEKQTEPPEPQLQLIPGHPVHPLDELKMLRDQEDSELRSYGWVDEQAGVVRIPIDKAKEKLLQQGVPVRKQQQ
jgi:hypothetical protein